MQADGLQALNFMLGEWSNKGLTVYQSETQEFTTSDGVISYTIGSGATWDGNRPLKINSMYISYGGVDYPLTELCEKDYFNISDKETNSMPKSFYYNPTNPNGTVYLYPEPDQAYTITVVNTVDFSEYSLVSNNITLPNGYLIAIKYNLALELQAEFQEVKEMNQWIIKRANDTLTAIKRTNMKPKPVKRYDPVLTGGQTFNFDRGY